MRYDYYLPKMQTYVSTSSPLMPSPHPPAPKDVIEIVKELQWQCARGDVKWLLFHDDRMKILDNFPAIAEALLRAMDALEFYERGDNYVIDGEDMSERLIDNGEKAKEALSYIHSLPVHE